MPKLTDTQRTIMSAAAQRAHHIAMPLPKGLHGAAAKMAVTRMITNGWLEEVDADLRCRELLWRETGDGHGTTLIATDAGLQTIGIELEVANTTIKLRKAKLKLAFTPQSLPERSADPTASKPVVIRAGTTQAQIIALIQRPEGASIAEIIDATGWLAHSARGMISGTLKNKLNLPITSEKVQGRGTIYRLYAAS